MQVSTTVFFIGALLFLLSAYLYIRQRGEVTLHPMHVQEQLLTLARRRPQA